MIDYSITIIQGFSVSSKKLVKRVEVKENNCEHEFDRKNIKFCPECGRTSFRTRVEYQNLVKGIDIDELGENDYELSNGLSLITPRANYETDNDYVLGVECLNEDPTQTNFGKLRNKSFGPLTSTGRNCNVRLYQENFRDKRRNSTTRHDMACSSVGRSRVSGEDGLGHRRNQQNQPRVL